MTALWSILLVLLACIIGSFGPIFFKRGISKVHLARPWSSAVRSVVLNGPLLLGVLVYGLSQVLFIPALRGGELSVLYPLVASTYVWVGVWSMVFLGERFNRWQAVGMALVIIGVIIVGFA